MNKQYARQYAPLVEKYQSKLKIFERALSKELKDREPIDSIAWYFGMSKIPLIYIISLLTKRSR